MRLTGAEVLWPDGLGPGELCVEDGRIASSGVGRRVDLSGFRILPGIVDLHGDGFERHIAPRRGAMCDLGQGIMTCDAELAANGITTAVLAQFFSWEGGMRGPDFAERFCHALSAAGPDLLTDMRLQLRFETHMLADYARFEALVHASAAKYVVFNDHLPHAALAKGKRPPRLTGQALKSGRNPDSHLALLQQLHERSKDVPGAVAALAQRLRGQGVLLGSHDDNSAAQRRTWRAAGVAVSEFPETREAACEAGAGSDRIVLGAPNVVRGGSHSGNVGAADLLAEGLGDALASDYHYPAPRQAVARLVQDGILELADAWKLISSGPASVLGLHDRGALVAGLRADLVVMDRHSGRIGATICGGRFSYLSGEVAQRFIG